MRSDDADVASLVGSVGTLPGEARDAAPLAPIAPTGTVVLSARPSFEWSPMPGARAYGVAVFDESFTAVARSGRLTTPVGRRSATCLRGARSPDR